MKTEMTLQQLAAEITERAKNTRDVIVPVEQLAVAPSGRVLFGQASEAVPANNWAKGQLVNYAEVPKQYADRIATENPNLWADSINHGLQQKKGDSRMLRVFNGTLGGLVSPRFDRTQSHYSGLSAILPVTQKMGMYPLSLALDQVKLYAKFINPNAKAEIAGREVMFGFSYNNSEVGGGASVMSAFAYSSYCLNGTVFGEKLFRSVHIGKNLSGVGYHEFLSEDTRTLTSNAMSAQLRDVLERVAAPDFFAKEIERFKATADNKIENGDLKQVIELAMEKVGLTGDEIGNGILSALANPASGGNGLTQWGLSNAVTYAAHQLSGLSYAQSDALEIAGGKILELNQSEWKAIAA